jgi:hypothetical protein
VVTHKLVVDRSLCVVECRIVDEEEGRRQTAEVGMGGGDLYSSTWWEGEVKVVIRCPNQAVFWQRLEDCGSRE